MKMKRKIFYFNIVEVALALAIVGIGIAGIMALFPVALNASRDAVGDNNAPEVAEQMLTFIEAQANANTNAITNWSTTGFISTLGTAKPSVTDTADATLTWAPIPNTNIYRVDPSPTMPEFFKVEQKTRVSATNEIVDFSAIVRVWRAQISLVRIEGTSQPVDYQYGADVFVEVSWPAERPYSQREKRVYMLELFNQNAN